MYFFMNAMNFFFQIRDYTDMVIFHYIQESEMSNGNKITKEIGT